MNTPNTEDSAFQLGKHERQHKRRWICTSNSNFVRHDFLPDIRHEVVHELEVVDSCELPEQRLLRLEEVVQVGQVVVLAGRALARRANRLVECRGATRVADVQLPLLREERAVSGEPCWEARIERVYA